MLTKIILEIHKTKQLIISTVTIATVELYLTKLNAKIINE